LVCFPSVPLTKDWSAVAKVKADSIWFVFQVFLLTKDWSAVAKVKADSVCFPNFYIESGRSDAHLSAVVDVCEGEG
jgi:predicted ABC-type transport system involved in lysophospholipase L1 biosynthesis ATPase subunit